MRRTWCGMCQAHFQAPGIVVNIAVVVHVAAFLAATAAPACVLLTLLLTRPLPWRDVNVPSYGEKGEAHPQQPKQESPSVRRRILQRRGAQHRVGRTQTGLERDRCRWRGGRHRRSNDGPVEIKKQRGRRAGKHVGSNCGAQRVHQLRGRFRAILHFGEHPPTGGYVCGHVEVCCKCHARFAGLTTEAFDTSTKPLF